MHNICIGTAQFGMNYGIGNSTGQPDKSEIARIVHTASINGIFEYDTAFSYGVSESVLGEVFSGLKVNGKVKIITKLHPDFEFSGFDPLKREITGALDRLQIKRLWGLLIHRPDINGDKAQFVDAVNKLKQENIVKYFGVSLYHPDDALKFVRLPDVDIIQVPFNILDRRLLDNGFFEEAEKMNKKIYIRSVYLQGLLLMGEDQIKNKRMAWVLPYLKSAQTYAAKHHLSIKEFAFNSIKKRIPRGNMIIGMETEKQLKENIGIGKSDSIPEKIYSNWWSGLPRYPEKLVNPSLW